MSEEELTFLYKREYWYLAAFIDSERADIEGITSEIRKKILEKSANLTNDDLRGISYNKSYVEFVKEMGRHLELKVRWVTVMEGINFYDENTAIEYDTLGYFEFEAEYFPDEPSKKLKIKPIFLQQIPIAAKEIIREMSALKKYEYLKIDAESPIYIFFTSDKIVDPRGETKIIPWTEENIDKYKRLIGKYTVLYSGQWPDYNDKLYTRRVEGNLSNRLSELHYLRKNSGFIYMEEENFKMFFEGYIKPFVIDKAARIRTIGFALMSINTSLDIMYIRESYSPTRNINKLEKKIKALKRTKGIITTALGSIYDELYSNKREHYTAVLKCLLSVFEIESLIKRFESKLGVISEFLSELYRKGSEEISERQSRAVNILGILFGASVFADIADLTGKLLGETVGTVLNWIILFVMWGLIFAVIYVYITNKKKIGKEEIRYAVDGVILDDRGNVVMIRRKYPPYAGFPALPGGFIRKGEEPEITLKREMKEETNLEISVICKIGTYDKPDRDPRGRVISHVFLCKALNTEKIKGGDDAAAAHFIPIKEVEKLRLAFDHNDIINDAIKIAKEKGLLPPKFGDSGR